MSTSSTSTRRSTPGRRQTREQLRTRRVPEGSEDGAGDRTGFGGRRYETERLGSRSFDDAYDDYLGFLEPFLVEAQRLLTPSGSLYLHLDYREVHYAKVLADRIFGRVNFVNEIIWAYDYGARPKRRWPAKHDNILFYAKDAARNRFNAEDIERIPYMAPGLAGPREGGARQAADRHLVAHDRQPDGQGEARLPDAEAARRPRTHRARLLAPRRAGVRLRRGQRHDGRGGAAPRPPLPPRRRLAGGVRGDAPPLRRLRGRRVRGRDRRLMQDRYAGDIGDFGKYGLLRALCGEDFRLGVLWYRVSEKKKNNDGGIVGYLKQPDERLRRCDKALFDSLRELVLAKRRSVAEVQRRRILPLGTKFYECKVPAAPNERHTWLEAGLHRVQGADLVFADPDNGLRLPHPGARGVARSPKHAYYDELRRCWERGQSLVIYQHATRHKGGFNKLIAARRKALREHFGGATEPVVLRWRRRQARAYFILAAPNHTERIEARCDDLLASAWGQRHRGYAHPHFELVEDA